MNATVRPAASDLAGQEYWEKNWKENDFRRAIDPGRHTLNNYVNLRFHDLFRSFFSGFSPRGKKLIELGCGSSEWLPYFAKEYGFEVAGLDYAERGCDLASRILAAEGVKGQIVLGDLFAPPRKLQRVFDVAVSFGVVEHFTDTVRCLQSMAEYLAGGGQLITVIPNMNGVPGKLQRWASASVYEKHVPIDREALARPSGSRRRGRPDRAGGVDLDADRGNRLRPGQVGNARQRAVHRRVRRGVGRQRARPGGPMGAPV